MGDLSSKINGNSKAISDFLKENGSKSLYICTMESNEYYDEQPACRYTVKAISFPDLFTFKDNIKVFPSKSSDYSQCTVLRELASMEGCHLPLKMGCGFFRGSQIVLAGGTETDTHNFSTSRDIYVCDITSSAPEFKSAVIPKLCGGKGNPLVVEINDKLYILLGGHLDFSEPPTFEVFDSKSNVWSKLPEIPFYPFRDDYYGDFRLFAYAVLGTKIMMCSVVDPSPVFLFDVADPHGKWLELLDMPTLPFQGKALVLDVEGYEDRKILCALDVYGFIGVYLMKLKGGIPTSIKCLDSYGVVPGFNANTFTCSDLGSGKVCFVSSSEFEDTSEIEDTGVKITISTFEFSYSSPAVEPLPSTDDGGSSSDNKFNMTLLGELTLNYYWTLPFSRSKQFRCGCVGLASSVF